MHHPEEHPKEQTAASQSCNDGPLTQPQSQPQPADAHEQFQTVQAQSQFISENRTARRVRIVDHPHHSHLAQEQVLGDHVDVGDDGIHDEGDDDGDDDDDNIPPLPHPASSSSTHSAMSHQSHTSHISSSSSRMMAEDEVNYFVSDLMGQMSDKFETMGKSILNRIDAMGGRIDHLERSIGDLLTSQGLSSDSKVKTDVSGSGSRGMDRRGFGGGGDGGDHHNIHHARARARLNDEV